MNLGIFTFNTEYTMRVDDLAREVEARGCESLWVPEHTHIPASRATPFPGNVELPREYSHMADPFASLAAAAAVTQRLSDADGHRCIVSSFSRDVLVALRPQLPAIPTALIAEALPEDGVAFCLEHGLEGMHLDGHQLNHESARAVLDAGLALRCYTINDIREAERLVALDVSMIMTDFPERFLAGD